MSGENDATTSAGMNSKDANARHQVFLAGQQMPIVTNSVRPTRKVVQRVLNNSIGYSNVGALNVQLSAVGRPGEDEVNDPRLEVQTSHGGSIGLSKTYAERYGNDEAAGPYEHNRNDINSLAENSDGQKQRVISSIQISNKGVA